MASCKDGLVVDIQQGGGRRATGRGPLDFQRRVVMKVEVVLIRRIEASVVNAANVLIGIRGEVVFNLLDRAEGELRKFLLRKPMTTDRRGRDEA